MLARRVLLDPHAGLGERGSVILLCGGRRFGGFSASTSSEGLCGDSPSRRSRFALLRIAQRGRCNRLTICDTECVSYRYKFAQFLVGPTGHYSLGHEGPQRMEGAMTACFVLTARYRRLQLFHMEHVIGGQSGERSKVNRPIDLPTLNDSVSLRIFICDFARPVAGLFV